MAAKAGTDPAQKKELEDFTYDRIKSIFATRDDRRGPEALKADWLDILLSSVVLAFGGFLLIGQASGVSAAADAAKSAFAPAPDAPRASLERIVFHWARIGGIYLILSIFGSLIVPPDRSGWHGMMHVVAGALAAFFVLLPSTGSPDTLRRLGVELAAIGVLISGVAYLTLTLPSHIIRAGTEAHWMSNEEIRMDLICNLLVYPAGTALLSGLAFAIRRVTLKLPIRP